MFWGSTNEAHSDSSDNEDSSESENEEKIDDDLEAYLYSLVHHEVDLQNYSLTAAKLPFENSNQTQLCHGDYEVSVEVVGGEQHDIDNDTYSLTGRSREAEKICKSSVAQIRVAIPPDSFIQSNTASSGDLLSSGVRASPASKNGTIISETILSETQTLETKKKSLHSERNSTGNISASPKSDVEKNFKQKDQKKILNVQKNMGGKISSCKTGRKNMSKVIAPSTSGSSSSDSDKRRGIEAIAPWMKQDQKSKKAKFSRSETLVPKSTTEVVIISSDSSDSESLYCFSKALVHTGQNKKNRQQTLSDASVISVSDSSSSDDSSSSSDSSDSVVSGIDDKAKLDLNWNVSVADQEFIQIVEENQKQETEAQVDESKWKVNKADEFRTGKTKRYYSKLTVHCQNCKEMGHLSKECLRPKKHPNCGLCGMSGHILYRCPNRLCFNCDQPGHISQACPHPRRDPWAVCQRCQQKGHTKNVCPDHWRQYHVTNPERASLSIPQNKRNTRVYCCNCASQGHFVFECTRERLDKYSYAPYPFVSKYDLEDASRLQKHRANIRKTKVVITGPTDCKGNNVKADTHKGFALHPGSELAQQADAHSTCVRHPHQNKHSGPKAVNGKLAQGTLSVKSTDKPKGNYRPKIKRAWRDTSDIKAFDCVNIPCPKKKKDTEKRSGIHGVSYGQEQQCSHPGQTDPKQKSRREWVEAVRHKKQAACKHAAKNTKAKDDSNSSQQAGRVVTKSRNGFRISVANSRLSQRYHNEVH